MMNKQIINFVAGKIRLQKFFEVLYSLSIYGMNYGNGGDFRRSGEYFAAQHIKSRLSNLHNQLILFDVGANTGHYSVELSNIFSGKNFNIHSFEPSKKTFEQLVRTTSQIPDIHLNNFGFSDNEDNHLLYSNGDGSALASIYHRNLDHFGISMDISEEIKLTTIDSYCKMNNINQLHFLKLDIEGHELSALKGASNLLEQKKINFIQFEFGGCNIDSRTYFQDFWYLLNENYTIYRIVKNGLQRIKTYNQELEIFNNINYLAELKE